MILLIGYTTLPPLLNPREHTTKENNASSTRIAKENEPKNITTTKSFTLKFGTKPMEMQSFHSELLSNNLTFIMMKQDLSSLIIIRSTIVEMEIGISLTSLG